MTIANINCSTGDRQLLAAALVTGYDYGTIDLYSGAKPADADSAATGTLLAHITKDGAAFAHGANTNGLRFTATAGIVSKNADVWKAIGVAIGTIGWGRLTANPADTGGVSTSLPRRDFDVGVTSGALQLTSLATTVGSITTVDNFTMEQASQ